MEAKGPKPRALHSKEHHVVDGKTAKYDQVMTKTLLLVYVHLLGKLSYLGQARTRANGSRSFHPTKYLSMFNCKV